MTCATTILGTVVCPSQIVTPFDPWAPSLGGIIPQTPIAPPPPPPAPVAPASPVAYYEAPPAEDMPMIRVQMETPAELLNTVELDWPVGSVARLFAPFPVDRGLWVEPRLVDRFVKTPNERWTSYPGNDVSYPTLSALALAAPVMEVTTPAGYPPAQIAAPMLPEIEYPDDSPPDFIPLDAGPVPPAPAGFPWLLAGLAAGALFLLKR